MDKNLTNKKNIKEILLWLFVINLGIAAGAGLYEDRIVISQLAGSRPETWINTGLMFWVYVTTVPLTLLIIANTIIAWTTQGPRRSWYLVAVTVIIIERIATFSYFIPTMAGLIGSEGLSQVEVDSILSQWMLFNHGRHVLSIAGWLAAMKAMTIK